jgi:hypothetical protein
VSVPTATLDPTLISPRGRAKRATLIGLIQEQVLRIALLRTQIAAGEPVRGDLAAELRELELLQDRLDEPE